MLPSPMSYFRMLNLRYKRLRCVAKALIRTVGGYDEEKLQLD